MTFSTLCVGSLLLLCSAAAQTPSNSKSALDDARNLVRQDNLSLAHKVVRDYLSVHPESADGHFLLGYILFRQRDPKSSLAEYTEGAKGRAPGSYDLEAVGGDYVLLKDYVDADKWLSKAVEQDPANLSALYYLGRAKYSENRFQEAIAVFQQCLQREPKTVKYEDNLGLSFEGLGRDEEAEAAFRSALEWDSGSPIHNPGPYLDLGSLLVDTQHDSEAIPLLKRAIEIAPGEIRARTELGKAYLHTDQLEQAERALEAAAHLEPGNAPVHFMLAQVYRKRGQLDRAKAESEMYTRLNAASTAEGAAP